MSVETCEIKHEGGEQIKIIISIDCIVPNLGPLYFKSTQNINSIKYNIAFGLL